MQLTVFAVSLIFMVAIAMFFVSAVRASQAGGSDLTEKINRSHLFWGMLAFGFAVTLVSLWEWPHRVRAGEGIVTINATSSQWYWEIDKEEVPLGQPVVFNVHTTDVTHGLGVVDASGRLLFQTQAMPGYVNKVEHVFTKTGEYKVICMEFCGVGHHDMITKFNVIAE